MADPAPAVRTYRDADPRLDNEIGYAAHRRAGYQEVDRVVQFRKALNDDPESPAR